MDKREVFDGFRIVRDSESLKYGIISLEDELVVPFEMDEITEFDWNPLGEAETISVYDECGYLLCKKGIKEGLFIPRLNKYIEPQFQRITVLFLYEDEETGKRYYRVDYKCSDGTYGYFTEDAEMIPCEAEDSAFTVNPQIKDMIWEIYQDQQTGL
jgi:hypothetical protein